MTTGGAGEQLVLSGLPDPHEPSPARRARRSTAGPLADRLPVARVAVDRPQPHLDRPFEYAVPAALDAAAQPGVRVKVRFAGQDIDGYVLARRQEAEHDGELTPLRRVVSPEVVLTPDVARLAEAVARRYVGTLADVLRLAVPPRHARVEQETWAIGDAGPGEDAPRDDGGVTNDGAVPGDGAPADGDAVPGDGGVADRGVVPGAAAALDEGTTAAWQPYPGAPAFLRRVAEGQAPRAVWSALPGPEGMTWADAVAQAVAVAARGGRGALVVVPSAAQVSVLERSLERAGVAAWRPGRRGGWVRLVADDGPAARYRSYLAAGRGLATVVIGTRAAAFAPVADLGLAVCWDDVDELHHEPRAPYPHAREVLALRSELSGTALLVGGWMRSVACQRWVSTAWAHPLGAPRAVVRERTPRVTALTSVELAREGPAAGARLPSPAWRAVRDGLVRGPVLIQVPRAGYVPSVACATCRAPARCPSCSGPLHLPARDSVPQCRWCGRLAGSWRCSHCSATAVRSVQVGSERTAEELGRAFPGVPVRVSGASATGGVIATVGDAPALVIATPGAEPVAAGAYAAAVLLDAATVTARSALDVTEQAVRTWMAAAVLVRPATAGGVVLLVGDGAPVPTQALVRWDPAWCAERELAERSELGLPPAVHLVAVDGPRSAVQALLGTAALPAGAEVLGPLTLDVQTRPAGPGRRAPGRPPEPSPVTLLEPESQQPVRALVRAPWAKAREVTGSLAAAIAIRSARREPGSVRVLAEPSDVA